MKGKRLFSILLTLTLIVAMLPDVSIPALAAAAPTNATELAAVINGWANGNGITATPNGATVTVTSTGTPTSTTTLELKIPTGVTVDWQATLEGSHQSVIIISSGGASSVFKMTGGSITSTSTSDNCQAIVSSSSVTAINIVGGTITSGTGSRNYGINNISSGSITISGGTVSGGSGEHSIAILNQGTGAVMVAGGIVNGGNGSSSSTGIKSTDAAVTISGGEVNGGSSNGFTVAIDVAYGSNPAITISGGKVISTKGLAVDISNTGALNLSGTAVVFGKDNTNAIRGVIPGILGNAAVVTWTGNGSTYNQNASTDLTSTGPSGTTATAKWDIGGADGTEQGVTYTCADASLAKIGFILVSDVTVTAAAPADYTLNLKNVSGTWGLYMGTGTSEGDKYPADIAWSVNASTGVLTLNGLRFTTTASTALKVPAGTTIKVIGDSSVVSTYSDDDEWSSSGINCSSGKLTIDVDEGVTFTTTGGNNPDTNDDGNPGNSSCGVNSCDLEKKGKG